MVRRPTTLGNLRLERSGLEACAGASASRMELHEYHRNKGSLDVFYELFPESYLRQVEHEGGGRDR